MQQLEIRLNEPGFTPLHRAGVAGMFLTLQQLGKEQIEPPGKFAWELERDRVKLYWDGNDFEIFDWLFKQSFLLDDEGMIRFKAFDSQLDLESSKAMGRDVQCLFHNAIMGTFLRHRTKYEGIPSEPGSKTKNKMAEKFLPVEDSQVRIAYKPLQGYSHQNFASDICSQNGLNSSVTIGGWLYPSGIVRHRKGSEIQEPIKNALALVFAPIACYYFKISSKKMTTKANYVLVVPHFESLPAFVLFKKELHLKHVTYKDFHAGGLGDAGLKFLSSDAAIRLSKDVGLMGCEVTTFGKVGWSPQSVVTSFLRVEASDRLCRNYRIATDALSDRVCHKKDGDIWVDTNFIREQVVDNLVNNAHWYSGFANLVSSSEKWQQTKYLRSGLIKMTEQMTWTDQDDQLLLIAFKEALRNYYGRKSSGGQLDYPKVSDKLLYKVNRIKSGAGFRSFAVNFMANNKPAKTLIAHSQLWDAIRSTNPVRWKKNKDLFVLAIAVYSGKNNGNDEEE